MSNVKATLRGNTIAMLAAVGLFIKFLFKDPLDLLKFICYSVKINKRLFIIPLLTGMGSCIVDYFIGNLAGWVAMFVFFLIGINYLNPSEPPVIPTDLNSWEARTKELSSSKSVKEFITTFNKFQMNKPESERNLITLNL